MARGHVCLLPIRPTTEPDTAAFNNKQTTQKYTHAPNLQQLLHKQDTSSGINISA